MYMPLAQDSCAQNEFSQKSSIVDAGQDVWQDSECDPAK